MNAIITASIGGLCVAIPSIITIISNIKRNNELLKYRLDELTSIVKKHEKYETKIVDLEESFREMKLRIDTLSKQVNRKEN